MIMKKTKYYSLERVMKKDATYTMVFGKRSNGKTYAALSYAIRQKLTHGTDFAIIRRWKEDVIGRRASGIFAQLNSDGVVTKMTKGDYDGVYYYAGKFYFCTYDDEGKAVYGDYSLCGYVFALSDTEHNKSVQYPNVYTVIFDEFLARATYLPDEFILFMNTLSTIIRNRLGVKIIMLGNTVNTHCPYFREMGLNHVMKMNPGDIDVYKYGNGGLTVAVEYSHPSTGGTDSSMYFGFDNPRLNMITDGAWELDAYPHCPVKYTDKQILFTYFIIFDELIYQCEIVNTGKEMFTFIHQKTTPIKNPDDDIIYSLDYVPKYNYNRDVTKANAEWQKKIKWFWDSGRVYYQDNMVGNNISQYLIACKR